MNAYNELYVSDASQSLGEYFDYMTHDLKYDIDKAFSWLAFSRAGKCFGEGNPRYISGMSGVELARHVIYEISRVWEDTEGTQPSEKSHEYWAGWALAQYQQRSGISFSSLLRRGLKASNIMDMYILHEADIEKYYVEIDKTLRNEESDGERLKRLRAYAGYTQKQFSEESGVALRMIQLYEQGQNDIRKASVETVMKMADALNTSVEEILP